MAGYENDENHKQERQAAIRTGAPTINNPIACELCGSTWFYSIHAEQFSGGGYGSVEMRSITGNPVQMRICLCGNPIVPQSQNFGGSRALGSRESFYMSAKSAKTYREKHSLDHVAEIAASTEELQAAQAEIAEIKTILTRVEALTQETIELQKSKKAVKAKATGALQNDPK